MQWKELRFLTCRFHLENIEYYVKVSWKITENLTKLLKPMFMLKFMNHKGICCNNILRFLLFFITIHLINHSFNNNWPLSLLFIYHSIPNTFQSLTIKCTIYFQSVSKYNFQHFSKYNAQNFLNTFHFQNWLKKVFHGQFIQNFVWNFMFMSHYVRFALLTGYIKRNIRSYSNY